MKPLTGVRVIVDVPDVEAKKASEVGLAVIVKSTTFTVTVME